MLQVESDGELAVRQFVREGDGSPGMGAAGTALVGIVWFHEPAVVGRLVCMALVVVGIVGLQLQEGV
ncbi:DMT family transporter [Burkholderia metallica]|uniref:DMT family transporter n=1 Tax=Burkholderia metallica TaxID=488729 RepID=UPI001574F618|nr:hypothetical protein [Burkholderia metallica]